MKHRFFAGFMLAVLLMGGIAAKVVNDHSNLFEISKNLEIFTNLYKEVNMYYVDELNPGDLMRTGVNAMLESLDPFTNYISESDIEGYRYITEGKYNGIGAQIEDIDGRLVVVEAYEGSPADKAGMIVGDELIGVDGLVTEGRNVEEVGALLKGYPGTKVDIKVKRPGKDKAVDLVLQRDEVNIPNVPFSGMVSEDVGYLALTTFTRDAGQNVADGLRKLKEEHPKMKGVIFDLRGNGGGLLTEAVNVSNVFIDKNELVVTTKGKVKDWDRSFKTLNAPVDKDIPLVVLINKGSASASEIVSGTIQDLDRGVLMGQRSYGKGLVQNTRDIGYNAKVKLTTAKYYIPSGRCIQSVQYEKGEPVDIPEKQRSIFKTRSGRTVLDGGGVKPDLVLDLDKESDVLSKLSDKFLIFDYVTEYQLLHPTIAAVEDFHFVDWNGFITFLEKRNFAYDTESDKLIGQLTEQFKKDGYKMEKDINVLQQQLVLRKKEDLNSHKDLVVSMIEKEIANRYYKQEGKVKMGLRNDREIQDAISLLRDDKRYKALLTK